MQQMSYCPQCGNPVPAAVSGPVVCQTCGMVIQPQNAPTMMQSPGQPINPSMPPAVSGDYPTIANPYANPAASPTPPALPAVNVPPAGPSYPYANTPPMAPMTPQPTPGGYSSYAPPQMPSAPAPGSAPYPYPGAGMPQQPPRQNNPALIGVIVALVVILVAGGIAFALSRNGPTTGPTAQATSTTAPTATPQATATSSSSANLTTFTDSNNFYSIGVPSGWSQTDNSSGDTSEELFKDPQTGAVAEVAYLSGQQSPQTSDDQFLSGVGNVSNKQGPSSVNYAGETWAEELADAPISGQTERIDVLATNHGGKVVIVAFLAPVDSFATIRDSDFVPMFESFQFNS